MFSIPSHFLIYMNRLIKENHLFFVLMLCFTLVGGVFQLMNSQWELIFFFSAHRSGAGDFFFKHITKAGEFYPYLVLCILFLFIRFRLTFLLAGMGGMVSLISYLLKGFFEHARPAQILEKSGMMEFIRFVDGVDLNVGMTSFPSGHTLSAFALYGLMAFLIPDKRWGGILMFLMALSIGISRIYLVQHFPIDVYVGALCGVLIAMGAYQLHKSYPENPDHWIDRSLFPAVN